MIAKLIDRIVKKDAPIVVGLDPMIDYIPPHLLREAIADYGETLDAVGHAIFAYNKAIIDAVCDEIPAVKPQIAMYEQFGIPGLLAYRQTIEYAREKGLIVIADVKRGDIGSTSKAYANAHLGSVVVGSKTFAPFDADFATVNPYLGTDGVQPFIDTCNTNDKGIFILVKTSNPSSGEFQDKLMDSMPLYEQVARKVVEWGEQSMDGEYSNIGAVVGATYPEMGEYLRKVMKNNFILVPGYGAQGGKGKDLKAFFNKDGLGAIVNSSRGIICAYRQKGYEKYGEEHFAEAALAAVLDMKKDIKESI